MLKSTVHDDDLLSSIRQRLQTETDSTLPFLRRLMMAESMFFLIEHITDNLSNQQQQSILDLFKPFIQNIAYA